jgi:putative zinc finger protein
MDHKYIEEVDLVDRYLTGRLTADETAQFEEHFVSCSKCAEELWTTEDFIEGLRREPSYRSAVRRSLGPGGRWTPSLAILPGWVSFATAVLLIVTFAGAVTFFYRLRLSRIEADQAKSEVSKQEQRLEEERQAASLAESKHKETERELTEQLTQLQAQLQNERNQESTNSVTQNGASQRPKVNLAILALRAPRAGETPSGSANEIVLSPTDSSFFLSIGLEGKPAYKEYRITILNDQNRLVCNGRGLRPDRYNSLTAEFNSKTFGDGGYLLTLEGVSADGRANVVGDYPFRVLRSSQH